ncbi:MAG: HDOD domain-containing protein [Burkholderiales bacterium]|nr:HDOD domain-containing protein [Burkholderiales bacterium]
MKAVREELLKKIQCNANLPALGTSVSKVVQLASSNDEAVRNLANFIMSDAGLTQKILRVSNAACYRNNSGSPVTTITKAIFLLGFDNVKTTALGMMLVDRMSGTKGAAVRNELLHSLSASVFGRELARRSQYKDAEEAAIAALFKNVGRLLVAAHDHALYSEINALIAEGVSPSLAASQVIGCNFEALAEAVMVEWDIPETIMYALAPLPASQLKPAKTRQEWLQQVAAFSAAASELVTNPQNADALSASLVVRFGTALNFDKERLAQWVSTASQETQALAGQTKLASLPAARSTAAEQKNTASQPGQPEKKTVQTASLWDALEGGSTSQDADNDMGLPAEFLLNAVDQSDPTRVAERHASGKPKNARDLLFAGVQDVTEMMASGRCKTNDLIMLVLETIYRGMGFRFATVCLKDVKANQFRARIAMGENNAARQAGFVFSATPTRDLFHLAMENDADLLISEASDPKIRDLVPAWHRALLPDARSFIVLPLVVQKRQLGLFYADRALPALEGVPSDETAMIKMLKGQVVAALNSL